MNGALVTSTALREAAAQLVDLHGQHEHQVLLDPGSHLDLLDAFAGLEAERTQVGEAFARVQALTSERDRLAADLREKARREEYLQYQLTEIQRTAPKPGEDEELSTSRQVLANAERLQRLCAEAYTGLYEGDGAALPALAAVWKRVGELASIDPQFQPYVAARDAVKSQLEDLAYFLRSYSAEFDASPARLQEVEDRLAVLERLKKKHGTTLQDVIDTEAVLTRELQSLAHAGERASELGAELEVARAGYLRLAEALSSRRQAAATTFSARLVASLADLAMTRTRCEVRFAAARGLDGWSARGLDEAEFYISPNPGEDLRPLARIASGGELSRLMLALKTLASTDAPGKTLIFDEVDSGIGGTVADVVGARLRELAGECQVLCITHLPQIAAYGGTHYRIEKALKSGRTVTSVSRLGTREREEELARMIAGGEVSSSVRASAREMLQKKGAAPARTSQRSEPAP